MKFAMILFLTFLCHSVLASEEFQFLESDPNIQTWAFEVGFGSQSYMEKHNRVGVVSPILFNGAFESQFRLALNVTTHELANSTVGSFDEITLYLEDNSRLYKDLAYTHLRIGVGQILMQDRLYDGNVISVPVALGGHFIVSNSNRGVLSYYIEYRFNLWNDYDQNKILPSTPNLGLDEKVFFSEALAMGVRYNFW